MKAYYFITTAIFASSCAISTGALGQAAPAAAPAAAPSVEPPTEPPAVEIIVHRYVPHRVYDTRRNRFVDFETMLARLKTAQIIFLGEQHNDPATHRLQEAVLEGLARRRSEPIVLALEMFERDAQQPLDAYLAGAHDEAAFLAAARPWPRYATDYRPMVEFARSRNWPIVAGNVPRRFAQLVSRRGLAALDSLPAEERALFATELSCPRDDYWRRFRAQMGDLSSHGMQLAPEEVEPTVWRMYEAQCLKDETMGESIAEAAADGALVVHANGSFHSDRRMGTVERTRRRLPRARLSVVSFVPITDLDAADGRARRALGDWVVFTLFTVAEPKP